MSNDRTRETMQRRVLMIAYDFPPSIRMGAQACVQLARHLPLYGWEPVVLTVSERHIENRALWAEPPLPMPIIRTGVLPHPFTVYRGLKASIPYHGSLSGGNGAGRPAANLRSLRHWLISLLWIPDAHTGWIPPAVVAGLRAVRRHRIERIFSSSPHSTAHLVGLALANLTGLPWTAHFRDPWVYPEVQWRQTKPISPLSARIETALERMVVRRAHVVASVTEAHTRWLRGVYPNEPPDKFVTIPNGFDGAEWEALEELERATGGAGPAGATRPIRNDRFVITYAGTLYNRRSPLPLFRALRSSIDAGVIDAQRIQVDLLGEADAEAVAGMAAACGIGDSVNVTGLLSRPETLRRMLRSDLLLLLAEGLVFQIPGKTYEYLRAGRPILALTSEGAVADLLRRTGGARVVDPADVDGVTAAVREAYRRWRDGLDGPRPDPTVVASFDRRFQAGRFAALFDATPGHPREDLNKKGETHDAA